MVNKKVILQKISILLDVFFSMLQIDENMKFLEHFYQHELIQKH